MTKYTSNFRSSFLISIAIVLQAGCASKSMTGSGEQVSVNHDELVGVPANSSETSNNVLMSPSAQLGGDDPEEIQAVLDARYTANDIRHSFETKFGETIDCIDYYAQPGVKQLRALGRHQDIRAPEPKPPNIGSLPDFMFNGKPDRHGNPRACPDGTVPMLKYTADDVRRAGGPTQFDSTRMKKARPSGLAIPTALPETEGHSHSAQILTNSANITKTQSWMNVLTPNVPTSPDSFSLSQTWTYTGSGVGYGPNPCTTDCTQTIEAGWVVSPLQYSGNNPHSPHFFTFATNDGYVTGCFNNLGSSCLPWLGGNSSMTPGMTLPSSTIGGAQTEMQVVVEYVAGSAQWCLTINGIAGMYGVSHIGCWPGSDFHGTMQTAATYFQVGAEAYSDLDLLDVPMGSGLTPSRGYAYAGYHHDFQAYIRSTASWSRDFVSNFGALDRLSYGMATNVAAGGTWTNWFYFGNEPLVGWQASQILF